MIKINGIKEKVDANIELMSIYGFASNKGIYLIDFRYDVIFFQENTFPMVLDGYNNCSTLACFIEKNFDDNETLIKIFYNPSDYKMEISY